MIIYLLGTIALLLLIFHTSLHYNRRGRIANKIPGLPPLPLVGNIPSFVIPTDEIWRKISYLYDKYYPIFKIWSFYKPFIFVRHPEDLKIILSCKKNINKSDDVYENLKLADIDGILSSDSKRWHHRRKLLNYAFTANHLEIYTEKINKRASKLVGELMSRNDFFIENVTPILLKFTLAAVCDAAMDFDTDDMPPEKEQEFRYAVNEFFEISAFRTYRPYLKFMMPFLPIGRQFAKVCKAMHSFRSKILIARRKYHEIVGYSTVENNKDNSEDSENNSIKGELKKNWAVIDLLLIAEKKGLIDNHGILEEVLTIVGAGYETTGMAIAFLFILLAENREQQNLARAEISEVLGDDDSITVKHMKKMDYLDRCVKESLRLFPTAPHIGRRITDDIRLRITLIGDTRAKRDKYTLPAGSIACISLYDLHRDPNFWPEPDKFDPDRFLPENVQKRHPHAYLPFSTGPRNCIGQKLAMAEIKLVAAHILHNFYLEPIDTIANLKPEIHFTIKANVINLRFVKINRD